MPSCTVVPNFAEWLPVTYDREARRLVLLSRMIQVRRPEYHPAIPLDAMRSLPTSRMAYRPGRARKIAAFLDHLLVLLPFEPPYFEAIVQFF